MKFWLVIVEGKLLSCADQYRVYSDESFAEALAWAKKNGFSGPFGMESSVNSEVGMMNFHQAGGEKVGIMHVEVQG